MHFVGKEIIRFHCLYWPAMLRAAGVPAPTRVFAHGWLTKGGKKLSKTTGNTIDPDALIDRYGTDAFRYFFLREGSFGQDWDFTDEAFVKRYNSDLANDFGNLVSRALTMVARYCDGQGPAAAGVARRRRRRPGGAVPVGEGRLGRDGHRARVLGLRALREPRLRGRARPAVELGRPARTSASSSRRRGRWRRIPGGGPSSGQFLYRLLEAIRLIAVMAWPVMPQAAERVLAMMGLAPGAPVPEDLEVGPAGAGQHAAAGGGLVPAHRGGRRRAASTQGEKSARGDDAPRRTAGGDDPGAAPGAAMITIDEFAKLELRVALVKSAEKIPGSKKLLKLQVDLGDEIRQIVSGIADAYTPESLVGRKVVLVANLKPAKLMGVESFGMVLAASLDGKAVLCTFDADVPPGTKVK